MTATAPSQTVMQIVSLTPAHAADAARLHILGQPGTFLTRLGAPVLAVLYRTLPCSAVGFGFTALSTEETVLGFVAVTTSTNRLFLEMLTRRLPQFVLPLLARFVRHPSLVLHSVGTLRYPLLVRENEDSSADGAELLAIMVRPDVRSRGIGAALLNAVLDDCRRHHLAHLDVTVDAANEDARRFYTRHGFVLCKRFRLYGRAMCLYRLTLAEARAIDEEWR